MDIVTYILILIFAVGLMAIVSSSMPNIYMTAYEVPVRRVGLVICWISFAAIAMIKILQILSWIN